MSKLGPLPPIGDTSLPTGVSQETWESSFKEALKQPNIEGNSRKGVPFPAPFPDASTTALSRAARASEPLVSEDKAEASNTTDNPQESN
mmetsp:Transcript_21204/g.41461  ORF Transcript_21204/g.41461 Transcript_21204/m.41461 type:complete len:89 (-) Transcript_21204:58-324(-)